MADKMRWRYGDTNPVVAAVDRDTVIEIGDLLYQDTDDAKPASSQADRGSGSANQEFFSQRFLGVAMQRSRSGDTDPIRVATTGVFEFDYCPDRGEPGLELGDLVGVDNQVGNDALSLANQQVARVFAATVFAGDAAQKAWAAKHAIGRVARRESRGTCSVLVDIRSSVMTGGVLVRG